MLSPDTSAESRQGRDLPTELFEHILDEVYDNRCLLTLKNCSLTNRFFRTLCQRRLLRRVVVKLEPDVHRYLPSPTIPPAPCEADELLEVLQLAPHLSEYIHVLTIKSDFLYPVIHSGADHWIARDPSLWPLVLALTNLRTFRVQHGNERLTSTNLNMPFITRRSVQGTLFDSLPPTLMELSLDLQNVPSRYYQSCHWIKNLSLLSLDYGPQQTLPVSVHPTLRLQQLEVGKVPPTFLSWLSTPGCPLDPGCIEKLTLVPRAMDDMKFIRNVGSRMTSVKEVRIDSSHLRHTAFAQYNTLHYALTSPSLLIPDIQSFKSLTMLSLSAAFHVRTFQRHQLIDYFTNPLVWITNLISSLPPGQLRLLTLDFSFVASSPEFPHEVIHLLRKYWVALHTALLEKQPSSTLAVSLTGLDPPAVKIVEDHLTSTGLVWKLLVR